MERLFKAVKVTSIIILITIVIITIMAYFSVKKEIQFINREKMGFGIPNEYFSNKETRQEEILRRLWKIKINENVDKDSFLAESSNIMAITMKSEIIKILILLLIELYLIYLMISTYSMITIVLH